MMLVELAEEIKILKEFLELKKIKVYPIGCQAEKNVKNIGENFYEQLGLEIKKLVIERIQQDFDYKDLPDSIKEIIVEY